MEDDAVETVQQPEPRKRAPRKKPDLSGVEPREITIKTKAGEKTFSARSRKQVAFEAPPPPPAPAPPPTVAINFLSSSIFIAFTIYFIFEIFNVCFYIVKSKFVYFFIHTIKFRVKFHSNNFSIFFDGFAVY